MHHSIFPSYQPILPNHNPLDLLSLSRTIFLGTHHQPIINLSSGATKPKPFQRKRPNLSHLPSAKLPSLNDMRSMALKLHKGSYRPCPPGESRRLALAIQHIFEGYNTFPLVGVSGALVQGQWRPESVLQVKEECLVFHPSGPTVGTAIGQSVVHALILTTQCTS